MKRFRLNITDKFEDRPRLITAYGRVAGGEVGVVLRPCESRTVVVLILKDSALAWENQSGSLRPGHDRYQALVTKRGTALHAKFSDENGEAWELPLDHGTSGQVVSVAVDLEARRAYALADDAVQVPLAETTVADAVQRIRAAQKSSGKRGPATFRGQWTGALVWDDGPPRIELRRKLASYGWLHIRSDEDGWRWMFDRQAKWFTSGAAKEGTGHPTLVDAIDAGVAAGLGLVREACGVRDTTRKTTAEEPPAPPVVPKAPRQPAQPRRKQTSKPVRSAPAKAPPAKVTPNSTRARPPRQTARVEEACGCDVPANDSVDDKLMAAFARALDDALVARGVPNGCHEDHRHTPLCPRRTDETRLSWLDPKGSAQLSLSRCCRS